MKILLTGGSGFLGAHLLTALNSPCNTLGRNKPINNTIGKHFFSELGNNSYDPNIFIGLKVLIHCAARVHLMADDSINPLENYRDVNTAGTLNLARQAVESGVKRFIFISTIKVNGEETELNIPFTASDIRSPKDFYGQSKSEAEEQLLQLAEETGLEVVIIRPTLIYGPGVKANFASLFNLVSKGFPLPFGCITDNKRSLVSVKNVVDLIVTCIDHPKAVNQVFLVSDDNDVSTASMVKHMFHALNKSSRIFPVPVWCYRFMGKVLGKQDVVNRILGSLQVDISHTKKMLGWTPPQTLEDGFKETAEAFLNAKKMRNNI